MRSSLGGDQYSHSDDHPVIKMLNAAAEGATFDPQTIDKALSAGSIGVRHVFAFQDALRWPFDEPNAPPPNFDELEVVIASFIRGKLYLTEAAAEIMDLASRGHLGRGAFRRALLVDTLARLRAIRDAMEPSILSAGGRSAQRRIARALSQKPRSPHLRRLANRILIDWAELAASRPEAEAIAAAEEVLEYHGVTHALPRPPASVHSGRRDELLKKRDGR